MLKPAPAAACVLILIFGIDPLVGAAPATSPVVPATQPTLARRLVDSTAKIAAARAAMEAAKIEAIRRYDAGKGRAFELDFAAKEAAADNADALDPQARVNVLSAFLRAKSELERAHLTVIETDPGVAAATQAVGAAHAEREALRREVDSVVVRD